MSNREIRQLFSLCCRTAPAASDRRAFVGLVVKCAYRLRKMTDEVHGLNKKQLDEYFRPQISNTY